MSHPAPLPPLSPAERQIIARVVDSAPPLTETQRATLAPLLAGASQ